MKKLFLALLFAPSLVFAQSAAYNLSQLAHQLLSGGTVPVSAGGTGITSLLGYANDCLVVNTGATGFSFATCGTGSGNVTDGAGTTTSNELLLSSTTAHTYNLSATLPISALPALTGDVTSSAGSNSVTVSKVNGASLPVSAPCLSTDATPQIASGCTISELSGSPTSGQFWGYNGTAQGWYTPTGSGTVNSGTTNQLAYYAANGTAVSGLNLGGGLGISSGTLSISEAVNAQGAPAGNAYMIASTDCGKQVTFNDASAVAVTVPQATTSFASCQFDVANLGAGTVTLTPTTGTVNGSASIAMAQNTQCTLNSDGANWQVIGCTALVTGGGGGNVSTSGTPAQYQTAVFASGTTITGVAPSATAGEAYISNGSVANPGFSASLAGVTSVNGTTIAASAGTAPGSTGTFTLNDCLSVGSTSPLEVKDAGACGGSGASSLGFAAGSISGNTTTLIVPGASGVAGAAGVIATFSGTIKNLYFRTLNAPASGQTFTATLYIGTPGSQTSTTLTCQIISTSPNNLCSDTTDTAAITAGQAWAIQIATSASSGATGLIMIGLEMN